MNDINIIKKLLENAGLRVLDIDDAYIYIEDPSCIMRSFESFMELAWLVLALLTGGLVLGWGISMIRGAKNDIKENFKNLILILGILTAVGPILNVIYHGDLFGAGCAKNAVPLNEVHELISTRAGSYARDSELYEDIDIYDTGPVDSESISLPDGNNAEQKLDYIMQWEPPTEYESVQ